MNKLPILFLGVAFLALAFTPAAEAHKTEYAADGTIKIVWGLLHEPAVTWRATGLDLRVTDNATGAGIPLENMTVNATLSYGDERLPLTLKGRHGQPAGVLTSQLLTPTRPGLYTLHLEGTIDGKAVDLAIPAAHDIEPAAESFFPEPSFDPYAARADSSALQAEVDALKTRIAALEAKADTQSQTPAPVTPADAQKTPGFGLVAAIGAVAIVLALRRRS